MSGGATAAGAEKCHSGAAQSQEWQNIPRRQARRRQDRPLPGWASGCQRLPAAASGRRRRELGFGRRLAVVEVQSPCSAECAARERRAPLEVARRAARTVSRVAPASARFMPSARSRHVAIASRKRLRLDRASARARAPTTPTTPASAPDNCVAPFELARIARLFHALRSSGFPAGSARRAPAWHARCSMGIGLRRGCHTCLEPNAAAVIERRASAP